MTQPLPYTLTDLAALRWRLASPDPLLGPPFPSPILADPTFLFPHDGPDGRWHLFAHSLLGIHHFISADGLAWRRGETVRRGAMRPHLFVENGRYHLLYEAVRHGRFPFFWLPGRRWQSRLEMITSDDLRAWSRPTVLLEPSLPWHSDARLGDSVSNPCLGRDGDGYRLYYSAGLTPLADCGFNEPTAIGLAVADRLSGPYRPLPDPLITPESGQRWCNLAAGAIKVMRVQDGWAGFQNGIYWDKTSGHSGSAIRLLGSADGLSWRPLHPDPILAPSSGWLRSHIYALDVRPHPAEARFYLYFNARDDWPWTKGRERLGLLVGD